MKLKTLKELIPEDVNYSLNPKNNVLMRSGALTARDRIKLEVIKWIKLVNSGEFTFLESGESLLASEAGAITQFLKERFNIIEKDIEKELTKEEIEDFVIDCEKSKLHYLLGCVQGRIVSIKT